MNGILDAAVQVDRFLQEAAVRYCLIGGIALQRWSMPRTTLDVDCTVMTEFGREEAMVAMLLSWFRPRVPDAATFATRSRVLLAVTDQGVGVDVSLGALPFESRMIERSSTWELDASRSLRTCSAEDLIVQKAFAGRDQDWVDIDTILVRRSELLDQQLILQELRPLSELKEDPDSLHRLTQLLRAH
jgi:hypothetical protein